MVEAKAQRMDNVSLEYEIVDPSSDKEEPGLQIAANGNEEELKKNLQEVMEPIEDIHYNTADNVESGVKSSNDVCMKKDTERGSAGTDLDEDCILFHGINYLGCASVNAPRSESEALRTIKILRNQHSSPQSISKPDELIEVILSVPNQADGNVRLMDPAGDNELGSFKVYKVLFCIRGPDTELERDCFAFTVACEVSEIFQCHVFQCEVPEAVKKVLNSFEIAFQSIPKYPQSSLVPRQAESEEKNATKSGELTMPGANEGPAPDFDENLFCFEVTLEIRESDGKSTFTNIPWDKASSCFKLRKNLIKQVIMSVTQTTNVELTLERCFGLLIAPGRNVRHSDMHLLNMDKMTLASDGEDGNSPTGQSYVISGLWDPNHPNFALLNEETQKGTRVFISIAIDLVMQEIQEPVRLLLETKARIFPQREKFWYFGKKILREVFRLKLTEIEVKKQMKKRYAIVSLESETCREQRIAQSKASGSPGHSISFGSPLYSSTSPQDEEDDDDTDEPLLSGSGEVSKDCSEHVLTDWGEVLKRWRIDFSQRPSGLKDLVKKGIPNALRGEVWQLLSGCHEDDEMLEKYRVLISEVSPQESVIQRDIHRTFPAHDYFKLNGGVGQESLYKISKAYSIYDREVGYCQGLSFLAAALLLHMPEEQAFTVLCKIMKKYKMRELFKNGFETLHTKLYQLERLTEDIMPDLHDHFKQLSIEAHMYSSQWFLTLFTAKFPLSMVYRVIDLFLFEGEPVIFKVALSLLKCCRQDLLTLDFEGVLKFFRVTLPKKYRFDENTSLLLQTVGNTKITVKKLRRLDKEYENLKENLIKKDPYTIIERDNHRLMEANMRLEAENDDLAEDLTMMKISLETQLEKTMKHTENLQHDLTMTVGELRVMREKAKELIDENQRLTDETTQAKELCRREMKRQEQEIAKKNVVISDYKTITSQLSIRIEEIQAQHKDELQRLKVMRAADLGSDQPSPISLQQMASEENQALRQQIRDLELELAQVKLAKVESECKVQDLEHRLLNALKKVESTKPTWLYKTFSNLTSSKSKDPLAQSDPPLT